MEFLVRPRTGLSRHFPERAEHALIGLGPWNIHDTSAVTEALVEWACVHFKTVDVVVPGYEAAHVLVATGCPPRTAVIRAQRATSRLRNPAQRAFNLAGPRHTRVRQIIDRFYSPRAVRRYRPVIEEQAARLLEEMAQGPNPADLMTAYANALPLRAAREILAVLEHLADIYHSSVVTQNHLGASAETVAAATAAVTDFAREVIEVKRHGPDPAEPVGALIRAHSGSLISNDELIGTTAYLLITASEPLTAPLGTGALTLLTHPRQLRECVTDPGLWAGAVEEILRRHHGALGRPRVATEELSLHGVTIREGEGICCAMPAATHDSAHYPEPSRFDIHRTTDSSLAFGAGPHACLGAPLARLFLHTAFEALFTRFPDLTLATPNYEIPWEGDLVFTKPACLPVTW
ncbi:tRNA-dependent cyclodipeptide synthase [Streptomyces syringium]|uniref:tRNA-dependent cyclodipeptide synthase n=1 Tax=Streptomyces syringium TaxID=76729 RepID=UPI0034525318